MAAVLLTPAAAQGFAGLAALWWFRRMGRAPAGRCATSTANRKGRLAVSTTISIRLRRAALGAALVLVAVGGGTAARAGAPANADDAYLDGLKGEWDMEGTIGAKSVRYHARGERVLQDGFLRLHMIDAATPPHYEAELYLGYDAGARDYVAHWLDRFGAAGARVVASGTRDGPRLVLLFPYHEGAFRDTFNYHAASGGWSLLLESQAADGAWSRWAVYELTRPRRR